jgi:hypothetical protein
MCFMLHLRTCILGGQLQTQMHTSVVQDVASSSYRAYRLAVSNRFSGRLRRWRLVSAGPYEVGLTLATVLSEMSAAVVIGM